MVKADELRDFRPTIQYQNGEGLTLSAVQEAINDCAMKRGVPVAFVSDQVKSGGLFNSSFEDCIVMYHPEHPSDYFNFCIRVRHQGICAFVSVNDFGRSSQMEKANRAEFGADDRKGKSMSYKLGSLATQGLMNIGRSRQKLEEEQMYYQCVSDIFDEVIS